MCVKLVSAVAQCLYLAVMAAASLLFEFFFFYFILRSTEYLSGSYDRQVGSYLRACGGMALFGLGVMTD